MFYASFAEKKWRIEEDELDEENGRRLVCYGRKTEGGSCGLWKMEHIEHV